MAGANGGTPEEGAEKFEDAAKALTEAISIMARLRGPAGCPWDREQTFDSIKRHTLEETYEVFDAIERRAWPDLKDELGDLLLQVLFYSQMAAEAGYFDIGEVAAGLNAKLVRRHPHIFPVDGRLADAANAEAVLRSWEQIKRAEKSGANTQTRERASGLDDIPRTMPAMLEATKLGSRAAKAGFDWPDAAGVLAKVEEELGELRAELAKADGGGGNPIEEEYGDLLFTVVHLARHLKVDAESVLRLANAKFRRSFRAVEQAAGGYDALVLLTPERLDDLWNSAKLDERCDEKADAGG
ncbi:MAG TPA: nucleoside triphosphate pyrophosphohydrolase [Acidobacteriaceae bacterium]|nr:nucleoside triphosphate pyrophosphohydrolase [Acidobacteriaceae bacterium]